MNATQRKTLSVQFSNIEAVKAVLETIEGELQDAYNNKSDNWRDGDKGQRAQEQIEQLQEAIAACETVCENIENSTGD